MLPLDRSGFDQEKRPQEQKRTSGSCRARYQSHDIGREAALPSKFYTSKCLARHRIWLCRFQITLGFQSCRLDSREELF